MKTKKKKKRIVLVGEAGGAIASVLTVAGYRGYPAASCEP
jgi:hypothetical protein